MNKLSSNSDILLNIQLFTLKAERKLLSIANTFKNKR